MKISISVKQFWNFSIDQETSLCTTTIFKILCNTLLYYTQQQYLCERSRRGVGKTASCFGLHFPQPSSSCVLFVREGLLIWSHSQQFSSCYICDVVVYTHISSHPIYKPSRHTLECFLFDVDAFLQKISVKFHFLPIDAPQCFRHLQHIKYSVSLSSIIVLMMTNMSQNTCLCIEAVRHIWCNKKRWHVKWPVDKIILSGCTLDGDKWCA